MTTQEQDGFREYLGSIEDELLEAVTADYLWLAAQETAENGHSRFQWRRAACREECVRRCKPRIWQRAEQSISGPSGHVA
jgi:hypothetical protein